MAEEKKKHKSGYAILRTKLVKKDAEIAELKERLNESNVLKLEEEVALWKNRHNAMEQKNKNLRESLNRAIAQMGWLRRLIYHY